MIVDRWGRPLSKVRVVVTDRCNYRCIFCHREGQPYSAREELSIDDYALLASAFARLGVERVKLTGGEPLIRDDVIDVVRTFSDHGYRDISITTNGYFLADKIEGLVEAGLNRVNVSLHALNPNAYELITGSNGLSKVLEGVRAAANHGIDLKLNVVMLKGLNEGELPRLVELARKLGASLQLVELMPIGIARELFEERHLGANEIVDLIRGLGGRSIGIRRDSHNRPMFEIDGVKVELVNNWSNPVFCAGCNSVRITCDGRLKTCIYAEELVDLREAIRRRDVESLVELIKSSYFNREPRFKPFRLPSVELA